jgi:hypothetical protein
VSKHDRIILEVDICHFPERAAGGGGNTYILMCGTSFVCVLCNTSASAYGSTIIESEEICTRRRYDHYSRGEQRGPHSQLHLSALLQYGTFFCMFRILIIIAHHLTAEQHYLISLLHFAVANLISDIFKSLGLAAFISQLLCRT